VYDPWRAWKPVFQFASPSTTNAKMIMEALFRTGARFAIEVLDRVRACAVRISLLSTASLQMRSIRTACIRRDLNSSSLFRTRLTYSMFLLDCTANSNICATGGRTT
jgi:hypothetical protein